MNSGPLPAALIAAAPDVSNRLGMILRALAARIASDLLHHPRHVGLIVPLWNYITRTARRFDSAIARIAAGQQRTHVPRPPATPRSTPAGPRLRLPTQRAWLVATLKYRAAGYASQLNHLLSQPDSAALIAASPQAARLLRPLCHLLGITPDCLKRAPKRRADKRGAVHHPSTPQQPATDALPAPRPPRAIPPRPSLQPLHPGYPPPPCEHVTWWPWFPPRSERIA